MKKKEIINLIDTDLFNALVQLYSMLQRSEPKFNDLYDEYMSPSVGFQKNVFRQKLKLFVTDCDAIQSNSHESSDAYLLSIKLLDLDFSAQKYAILSHSDSEKKIWRIFLQGTPECGLEYFIMHRHKERAFPMKANEIIFNYDNDQIKELLVLEPVKI